MNFVSTKGLMDNSRLSTPSTQPQPFPTFPAYQFVATSSAIASGNPSLKVFHILFFPPPPGPEGRMTRKVIPPPKNRGIKTDLALAARHSNIHKSSSIRNPLLRPTFWCLLLLLRLNLKRGAKKKRICYSANSRYISYICFGIQT